MGLKHLEDVTYFRLNNEINRIILLPPRSCKQGQP